MTEQPLPWSNYGAPGYSDCWSHHQSEPIPRNVHIICFECGHVWTKRALYLADKEHRTPYLSLIGRFRNYLKRRRGKNIYSCPECIHDF